MVSFSSAKSHHKIFASRLILLRSKGCKSVYLHGAILDAWYAKDPDNKEAMTRGEEEEGTTIQRLTAPSQQPASMLVSSNVCSQKNQQGFFIFIIILLFTLLCVCVCYYVCVVILLLLLLV